jgi:hypothetical protein
MSRRKPVDAHQKRKLDGVDCVRCRICRAHLRVISGRHLLSKHGISRDTYVEEYGLTPDDLIAKDSRVLRSSRKDFVAHGKRDWIAALKQLYSREQNITAKHLQAKYPQLYYQGVWIFGDWDKALRAAGFNPMRVRLTRSWNEETTLTEIRRLRSRRLPLYAWYVMKQHAALFRRACRVYGTWSKALAAAGLPIGHRHSSPLLVLRALGDAMERRSRADIPQRLKAQAEHYFGSLRKAVAALKTDRRLASGWSKRKIIATLSRMHRAGKGLTFAQARRVNSALVSAAEAYFGSWGKALHAAGINPNLYFVHHMWRKTA